MRLFSFLLFLIGVLLFGLFESIYARYIKRNRFKTRENLAVDELYAKYFAGCGIEIDAFKEIIVELASVLHVPVGKLRPTDSFDKELKYAHVLDSDNDDLVSLFCQRIRKKTGKKTKDVPKVNTLEDYIKAIQPYI